ncbi:MAG TPA: arsenate reductase (thioredoxin) [Symbiobacteriaceae bacterium]|nr:arsenate reductase (thioredoxin) [Symbiobacteriaceae bacterium]
MTKRRVAFICTGNSCRSQMAEGWARALAGDKWDVYSAGLEAHGVNPRAVKVMAEAGVDITPQTSKTIDFGVYGQQQVIITLCGDANERCPIVPPTALVRRHWDLPDPAKAKGTEEEILTQFRAVRDDIRARIEALLTELEG